MSIYNPELRLKFKELNTLNFINEKENIILIRSPGSGKTHYSIGLDYVSFDQEGCEILYNLLSNRND